MAAHKGQINMGVRFDVDKQSLQQVKTELQAIQNMTLQDLSIKNPDMGLKDAQNKLIDIKRDATALQTILDKAFNTELGSLNLNKFDKELKNANIDLKAVYANFKSIGSIGTQEFQKLSSAVLTSNLQLRQTHNLLDNIAQTMVNTAKWGLASSVFNNMSSNIQKAWNYTVKLDSSLNDIRIVSTKSADEMERFAVQANRAAQQMGSSTRDFTEAALIYYQQGLGDEESAQRADITVKTANVTKQSTQQVSEELTAIWNGYKVSSEEAELYIDKVAKVAASTAADLEEMATAMSKVASAANSAGVDIDRLNGMLSTVISVTREAPETIGTSFRTIFARMGDLKLGKTDEDGVTLGKISGQMQNLGVQILDAEGNMRDMGDIIEDVAVKWQSWTRAQQQAAAIAMAGQRQYSRLIALFDNWDMYTKSVDDSKNALGELQREQDIYMESTEAHLQKLQTAWERVYDAAVNNGKANQIIDFFSLVTNGVANWIESVGGGARALSNLGSIATLVFSKHIAQGINTTIRNFQIAKENAQSLSLQLEQLRKLDNASTVRDKDGNEISHDIGTRTRLEEREKMESYIGSLTNEQIEAQEQLIDKYAEALSKQQQLLEGQSEAAKIMSGLSGGPEDGGMTQNEALEAIQNAGSPDTEGAQKYEEWKANVLKLKKEYQGLSKTVKDALKVEKDYLKLGLEKKVDEQSEKEADLALSIQDVINKFKEFKKVAGQGMPGLDVEKIESEITKLQNLKDTQFSEDNQENPDIATIEVALEGADATAQRLNDTLEKQTDIVEQTVEETIKQDGEVETLKSHVDSLNDSYSKLSNIDAMVKIAGATGMLVNGMQTLVGIFDIWNNQDTSGAEKVLQTVMALATALPMLITGYETLSKVMTIISAKTTVSATASAADATAKGVDAAATTGLTVAQWALNAAMSANPVVLIITGLVALAGAALLVTKAIANSTKEMREQNNAIIEAENATQQEIETNNKLYVSWGKMYDQYKNGKIAKDDLTKSTDDLVELLGKERVEIANLTGDYESLNEEILEAQKNAARQGKESAQREKTAAANNLMASAHKKGLISDDEYFASIRGYNGIGNEDEESKAATIINNTLDDKYVSDLTQAGIATQISFQFDASEEEMVKFYDQLSEAYTRMTSEMTSAQRSSSGIFQWTKKWIESMKDDVEAYKKATDDLSNYSARLNALNLDFQKDEGFESFVEKRKKLITSLKQSYKDLSDDKVSEMADKYISEIGGEKSEFYLKKNYVTERLNPQVPLTNEQTGEVTIERKYKEEDVEKAIGDLTESELKILAVDIDKVTSLENLKDFVNQARHEVLGKIDITDLITDVRSGKVNESNIKDNEQYRELISQLDSLKELYPEVEAAADELTHTWMMGTQEYFEALENVQDKLHDSQMKDLANKQSKELKDVIEKTVNEAGEEEITLKIDVDDGQFQNEMEDILNADYQIDIAIHTEAEQEFDSIVGAMEDIYDKGSLIGENWVVSADKVRELNDAFPGIIQGMRDLGDGTVQLNKDIANSAIEAAQTEVAADSKATIEKLRNQAGLLREKQSTYQEMANAATILAKSDVDNEQTASDARATISDGLAKLEMTNEQTSEEYSKESAKAIADDVYSNAAIVANNWKSAYQSAAADSFKFAQAAIQNNAAATGKGKATKGTFGSVYKGGTKGTTSESTALKETQSLLEDVSKGNDTQAKWAKIAEAYQQLANNAGNKANDIEGMIAEIGARNVELGKGFGKIKSGGGSSSEADIMEFLDEEADRYHKVNTQITKVDNSLKMLQSQQEKYVGNKLLENLNKQWQLLNTQISNYNEKLRIANEEEKELAAQLSTQGVQFNADGTIANYVEAIKAQEAYVNSLIANYNSMSKEQQENYKDTIEAAKDNFDKFKKDIDRYDELVTDFIPDLQQSIQDAIDKQIENNIQKFNLEIEVTLDMNQATRDWNEWYKKNIKGFKDEDIFGNISTRLKDFNTYFNNSGNGDIQAETRHLREVLDNLEKMKRGQDNIFRNSESKGLDQLQESLDKIMNSIDELRDLENDALQDVLNKMDEVQEKFDKQIENYEYLRDLINHDIKLTQLLLGEDAYKDLEIYYAKQQQALKEQLEYAKMEENFWRERLENEQLTEEERENATEKLKAAITQVKELSTAAIEATKDELHNLVDGMYKEWEEVITNGLGLSYINEQWDLINKNADRYLDTINSTYAIRELEKKYVDAINKTDNIGKQQKLKKVMDEQLIGLREKDRLTQYDVDRANKLYEIELARIALEEAQQNKSQMRLRRDSQGNYTYQYIADNDAITEAQNKVDELYNSLYNFDKERFNSLAKDWSDGLTELEEKLKATVDIADPAKRLEERQLIIQQYNELLQQVISDYSVANQNLTSSAFEEISRSNELAIDSLMNASDRAKQIILDEYIPTYANGMKESMDYVIGEGGIAAVLDETYHKMITAEEDYNEKIEDLNRVADGTFDTIINGEDKAITEAEKLIGVNEEIINTYGTELQAVKDIYSQLKENLKLRERELEVAKQIAEEAYNYKHAAEEKQAEEYRNQTQTTSNASGTSTPAPAPQPAAPSPDINTGGGSSGGGNGSPEPGEVVTYQGGRYYADSYGGGGSGSKKAGTQVKITIVKNGRPYPIHIATTSGGALGWIRQDQITGYDTGGYTGTWDNSGRLAMLHQKELVLNASDTTNMLNTVAIMRNLTEMLGSNVLARLAGASAASINSTPNDGALEQIVHIDAQFPNVRNSAEIEAALNNLVNSASQRIGERRDS